MRRLLTALLAALMVAGLLPAHRVRRRPDAGRQRRPRPTRTRAVGIVLTATDDSGADVTDFAPSDPIAR